MGPGNSARNRPGPGYLVPGSCHPFLMFLILPRTCRGPGGAKTTELALDKAAIFRAPASLSNDTPPCGPSNPPFGWLPPSDHGARRMALHSRESSGRDLNPRPQRPESLKRGHT
jgi:hypothetical protein